MSDSRNSRKTPFSAWRKACGLSLEEAAAVLGKTKQMIIYLDEGISPRGACVPQVDTRLLMTAAYKGFPLKPWPI
jgi:hypothetical protein